MEAPMKAYFYDILDKDGTVQDHRHLQKAPSRQEADALVRASLLPSFTFRLVEPADEASDFPETFYTSDREAAKSHATYPLTLEYIRRLEAIVVAARELHQHSPALNDLIVSYRNDLYDRLSAVNFLDEDEF